MVWKSKPWGQTAPVQIPAPWRCHSSHDLLLWVSSSVTQESSSYITAPVKEELHNFSIPRAAYTRPLTGITYHETTSKKC